MFSVKKKSSVQFLNKIQLKHNFYHPLGKIFGILDFLEIFKFSSFRPQKRSIFRNLDLVKKSTQLAQKWSESCQIEFFGQLVTPPLRKNGSRHPGAARSSCVRFAPQRSSESSIFRPKTSTGPRKRDPVESTRGGRGSVGIAPGPRPDLF